MGQAKNRQAEIAALKAAPKTVNLFWMDQTLDTVVSMELPAIVPEPLRYNKDKALQALYIATNSPLEYKNELCMLQVANILTHYHGKLQGGKCYFLETAVVGTVFGPKTSGEISQADFDRKVAIAKELA